LALATPSDLESKVENVKKNEIRHPVPRELEFSLAGKTLHTKGSEILASGQTVVSLELANRKGPVQAAENLFLMRSRQGEYFVQNEYPNFPDYDGIQPLTRAEAEVLYCELDERYVDVPDAFPKNKAQTAH
jgi:hypothetical protein